MNETIRRINARLENDLNQVIKGAMNHDYDRYRWFANEFELLVIHCELFDIVSYDDVVAINDSFRGTKIRIWEEFN